MRRTAMNMQQRLMYGLSLSPILAAFQTIPIVLSSHADSVPEGGNYDGAAGVVAGLLCLIRLKREATPLAGRGRHVR